MWSGLVSLRAQSFYMETTFSEITFYLGGYRAIEVASCSPRILFMVTGSFQKIVEP